MSSKQAKTRQGFAFGNRFVEQFQNALMKATGKALYGKCPRALIVWKRSLPVSSGGGPFLSALVSA
ncbi:hypothetical protein [Faecalispora anaeroviscerum]|uniref:hypothetical protein n=1 Tax=Faecalispora anaeroviscerum TaxID=2991836 RepID=UPI0024B8BBA8|nr:hypothetical protein [Faecalispora anaeroviscerum]